MGDKRIAFIEDKMRHESLSLKEDKPKVEKVNALDSQAKTLSVTNDTSTLKEQLDALTDAMSKHRDAKKALNEKYTELMQERNAQMGDSQELYTERDQLNEQVREKIAKRNELRDDFRQKEREYYEYEKELRN